MAAFDYSFVRIKISLFNLVFETKIAKVCYPERGWWGYFEYEQKNNLKAAREAFFSFLITSPWNLTGTQQRVLETREKKKFQWK